MTNRSREIVVLLAVTCIITLFVSRHRDVFSASTHRGPIKVPALTAFPDQSAYRATATLNLDRPTYPISERIYGVCDLPAEQRRDFGIAITRWGGNASSRYNWKINADNGCGDWYFKNRGMPFKDPTENGYLQYLDFAKARGATTYQTIPMLGWVAKDNNSYSYPVKKFGKQQQTEPKHPDVGNGVRPDSQAITDADPNQTSTAVGPEFVEEAVRAVAGRGGKADGGGVQYWVLDNEPMLWHQTHRDVRPQPLGYDELWDLTVKYAEAIKRADPTAKVAGFCSWGWTDLFFSAKDEGNDKYATQPDNRQHGRMPLAEWFIRKCGEYKKEHGRPLIDVFDFHWYPQAEVDGKSPYLGKGMGQPLNALRMRSTRDLWDPNYKQESWIHNASDGRPTQVIRRVRQWVDRYNPGMEICLGEYNFGGGDTITGGLAQADVLGILGREKVDLAFIWQMPEGSQILAWELFRNFDGHGGRFGDQSLDVTTSNPELSVYAARRKDGATTIVAINKNLGGACNFDLDAKGLKGKLSVWRFDPKSGRVVEVAGDSAQVDGVIRLTLPAASASMLVVRPE